MSARRRHQVEDEDAATLKLGSEFNNAGCLMISEVKLLLARREEDKAPPDTAVFKKTKAYVETFSKFTGQESAGAVRQALNRETELTQFELAQIANLCPATAEEAKNCIPSLEGKIDEDRLHAILDEVQTLRRFQN